MAIYEWVKRHFPVAGPRVAKPGRKKADQFGERAMAYRLDQLDITAAQVHIAEAIIWKLRHRGQKATYFVRDALPDIQRLAMREVTRQLNEMARDARREARRPPIRGGR